MEIAIGTTPLGRQRAEALVLFACEGEKLGRRVASAGREFKRGYDTLVLRGAFRGEAGQLRSLTLARDARIPLLLLAGVGKAGSVTGEGLRTAAASAARAARDLGAKSVTFALPAGRGAAFRPPAAAEAVVEGAVTGLYRFETYRSKKSKDAVESITVLCAPKDEGRVRRAADEGRVLGEAVGLARTLGNEPGNTATPSHLAAVARGIAEQEGLKLEVLEEEDMKRLGMGALLGVAQGSAQPAKLIVLTYEPRRAREPDSVAIVGKGLTFDSGGISIKPGAQMEDMKFDMCGGAAVIAAMQAVARLRAPVRVVGLVPASENMPGGGSYKPGDILKAMNGTTIEIRNTDAEGRLILADALAYATGRLRPRPKAVIDLATLTGACVVALGDQHAALVSNDEKLAERLLEASRRSGDALWRMPLNDGHRKQIESPYADISNLGTPGAGVLTAAALLERFTGKVPWAHLDIAGMAWTKKKTGTFTTGATGFGVRVLARLLAGWTRA